MRNIYYLFSNMINRISIEFLLI